MKISYPKSHGVVNGSLLFGVCRLLPALPRSVRRIDEASPARANLWVDNAFRQASRKLSETVRRLIAASALVEWSRFQLVERRRPNNPVLDALHSVDPVLVQLDGIVFQLRILADCLAVVTPNLYGHRDGRKVSRGGPLGSFRVHRQWFLEKRRSFDAEYAAILESRTAWFDQLAGNPELGDHGLRDGLVHRRQVISAGFISEQVRGRPPRVELFAGIEGAGPGGWVETDVIGVLQSITSGLCEFLDAYVDHYATVLASQLGPPAFDPGSIRSTVCRSFRGPPQQIAQSLWLFPPLGSAVGNSPPCSG